MGHEKGRSATMAEREPVYDVVWPLGRAVRESVKFSKRLPDLNGKTIAELSDFDHGHWFPVLREALKERYPDVNIVEYPLFGATHGRNERQVVANLPDLLKEYGVDAVVSGIGL